jgi:hypothetical protein
MKSENYIPFIADFPKVLILFQIKWKNQRVQPGMCQE